MVVQCSRSSSFYLDYLNQVTNDKQEPSTLHNNSKTGE